MSREEHMITASIKMKGYRTLKKKTNCMNVIGTDDLCGKYDFIRGMASASGVIDKFSIAEVAKARFDKIDDRIVSNIFELAEKCEVNENNTLWNFYVYSNGTIKIGCDMEYIKENLEELKKQYQQYKREKHLGTFGIVKFNVKENDTMNINDDSNLRMYNIALNYLMEKIAESVCRNRDGRSEYYNGADQYWVLYELSNHLAKKFWDRIVERNILDENIKITELCPFCLYTEYMEITGDSCPHAKHHSHHSCYDCPIYQSTNKNILSGDEIVEILIEIEESVLLQNHGETYVQGK